MSEVLKTVYSPAGEKFEMSPANARDVVRHAGWSESKPHPDDVAAYLAGQSGEAAAITAEEPAAPTTTEEPTAPNSEPTEETVANDGDDDSDEDDNSDSEDEATVKTEPNHFADMDREAVRAYIDETFPGTEIDGRWNRDRLVAVALELAAKRD